MLWTRDRSKAGFGEWCSIPPGGMIQRTEEAGGTACANNFPLAEMSARAGSDTARAYAAPGAEAKAEDGPQVAIDSGG
jgi:hypothetical protein